MRLPEHTIENVLDALQTEPLTHAPRVLILYGSLRPESYSKKLALLSEKILISFGADVRIFHPHDLPVFDRQSNDHPEVQKLRQLSIWSEAHVWISPEQHGSMTAAFKNQIDWLPLSDGAVRPTQGRTLALMQVSGGSQSFNAVNQMRILGRWMRMFTIPNQSSVAMAWKEFDDETDEMRESGFKSRVIDVLEELFKITLLMRSDVDYLSTRFSEHEELRKQGKLTAGLGVKDVEG